MKNLYLFCLVLFVVKSASAQNEVLFKMQIMPNHEYDMAIKMNMNMVMDATGDTAAISKLKQGGQSYPVLMNMETNMGMDIKTAMLNKENRMSVTSTIKIAPIKMTVNGKGAPMPAGALPDQTLFGTYTTDGVLVFDSIAGKKMDAVTKATMTKMTEGMQTKIKFPDKPMKIGDTFTQDLPVNLPAGSVGANMKAKTTYTLLSISGTKATFDFKGNLDMDVDEKSMALNMSGSSEGKMVYDTTVKYPTSLNMTMNISYSMSMPQGGNTKINAKMKMVMDSNTTVSAN